MDPQEYRDESRERWERAAGGWSRRAGEMDEATRPVSDWMVEALAPQPGQTILELAGGPGQTFLGVAERVQPGGRLIVTDQSEAMAEAARERIGQLGTPGVEARVLDGEAMDLPTASVDGVLCRFGYMLMADPATALGETRRVLRPGGRVALAVWDGPEVNPWIAVAQRELIRRELAPPPDPAAPGMFSLADAHGLDGLLAGAGFADREVRGLDFEYAFATADQWWELMCDLNRTVADADGGLDDAGRAELRAAVADLFRPWMGSGGEVRLPARVLVAAASA